MFWFIYTAIQLLELTAALYDNMSYFHLHSAHHIRI